jgi:hypothetical protein
MQPMSLDDAFGHASRLAMLGWLALCLLPRWRGSQVLAGLVIPAILSLGYVVLIAVHWHDAKGGFASLDGVATLFQSRPLLLAGWVHYLAFDLFLGAWILRRSQEAGIPHLLMVPVLLATFLFGPAGYLSFLLLRLVWRIGGGPDKVVAPRLGPTWLRALRLEANLLAGAAACLALMVPTGLALALDARMLADAPVWLKPLKFEASLALYLATLALFVPLAGPRFRTSWLGRYAVWGAIVPSFLEIAYIGWRASRAEASHYNVATPLDAALYSGMAVAAVMLTAAALAVAVGLMRRDAPPLPPALRWSIVSGLVLTFVLGVWNGLAMGGNPGGHFVGVAPPIHPTVPVLGWSLAIGDLRVAHFLALHALQLIPAFGLLVWCLTRAPRTGTAAVGVFAAAYAGVTLSAFAAARAARPLLGLG